MKVHAQVFDQSGHVTRESNVAMQIAALDRRNRVHRKTPMTTLGSLHRQRADLRAKLIRGY